MTRTQRPQFTHTEAVNPLKRSFARQVFVGFVLAVVAAYSVILGYHFATPRRAVVVQSDWLDCCRELCLRYGLIPTGHIANDAKAYLEASKSEEREQQSFNTSEDSYVPTASQEHPLIGHLAPNFQLMDDRGDQHELGQLTAKGPVVLVFYYGYHCSHCVAQLFAIQEELAKFRAIGATVVALSGDDSEQTAERFAEYGRFDFPVLSDPNNIVAELYDVYRPETSDHPEILKHGTFLIEQSGKVAWANLGTKPFIDNKSLLSLLSNDLQTVHVAVDNDTTLPLGSDNSSTSNTR